MYHLGFRPFILEFCALATLLTQALSAHAAAPASITVQADKPGAKIGPLFYGLMTEEISHTINGVKQVDATATIEVLIGQADD